MNYEMSEEEKVRHVASLVNYLVDNFGVDLVMGELQQYDPRYSEIQKVDKSFFFEAVLGRLQKAGDLTQEDIPELLRKFQSKQSD